MQHVNDLALYIDLDETLTKAEGIFRQIKDSPSVGPDIRRILGIDDTKKEEEDVGGVTNGSLKSKSLPPNCE